LVLWTGAAHAVLVEDESDLPGAGDESAADIEWRFLTGPRPDLTLEPPREPPAYWSGLQQQLDAYLETAPDVGEEEAEQTLAEADEDDAALGAFGEGLVRPFLQSLMALLLVLGLFLLLSYGLRRFGQRSALIPSSELASVLGRVYLTPKVSIHFVRVGDKVLLIGVGQNDPRLLTEFPGSAFGFKEDAGTPDDEDSADVAAQRPDQAFWDELQTRARELTREDEDASADAEITSLRDDIKRLQRTLQDSDREPRKP